MMCGICGCGQSEQHGQGAGALAPVASAEARRLQVELDLFSRNNAHARRNRAHFAAQRLLALNLVSSPGAGKTALLVETLKRQLGRLPVAVIEGDQQTSCDADRIRNTGAEAVQINTGKLCHLDAHLVGHALEQLPALHDGILYIENVGNLVCPAGFDLGEAAKVVILSVTEGDDKPLKYPDMFHAAQLMVLNKIDLLPYVEFDVERCIAHARQINPALDVVRLSARSGEGLDDWLAWLERRRGELCAEPVAAAAEPGQE